MRAALLLLLLPILTTTLSGCNDDDTGRNDPEPAVVANGVVKGSVLPAYAAEEVYLVSGTDTLKTIPGKPLPFESVGAFEFDQVKPGTYIVGVRSIYSFTTPRPDTITVQPGATVVVPKFELYTANNGLMSFTFNDTVYTGSPNLGVSPTNTSVSFPTPKYWFSITFPEVNGPGIYSTATFNTMQVRVFNWKQDNWYADKSRGFATMQVTAFNPASGIGNATFSFTAVNPGKPDAVVTKGTLYSVRLRP